jgi:hypothetical protein
LLTLPAVLQEYVTSQLTANYPEILINVLAHNPLADFLHPKPKSQSEVFLSAATQFPLQTFESFKENDPLAGVLSALSKLQTEETAVIQLQFRKTREYWKTHVSNAAKPSSEGQPATPPLHQDLVTQKLAQPSFQFGLRVVTQAPTQEHADQLRDSLVSSFAAFQSEANSLVGRSPVFRKQALVTKVIAREPTERNQFFFSVRVGHHFSLTLRSACHNQKHYMGQELAG